MDVTRTGPRWSNSQGSHRLICTPRVPGFSRRAVEASRGLQQPRSSSDTASFSRHSKCFISKECGVVGRVSASKHSPGDLRADLGGALGCTMRADLRWRFLRARRSATPSSRGAASTWSSLASRSAKSSSSMTGRCRVNALPRRSSSRTVKNPIATSSPLPSALSPPLETMGRRPGASKHPNMPGGCKKDAHPGAALATSPMGRCEWMFVDACEYQRSPKRARLIGRARPFINNPSPASARISHPSAARRRAPRW